MNKTTDCSSIFRRLLTVTVAGFILRAAFLVVVGTEPKMYLTPDSAAYLQLAGNMAAHARFSDAQTPPFEANTSRTPGYPAFLMPFHGNVLAVVWTQALLGAATAGLLFLTGWHLWRRKTAASVAGMGLAFDYVVILYSAFVMTEAVFLLCQVLFLLAFARFLEQPSERNLSLAAAGAATGVCALIRPASLYYCVVPSFILVCAGWTRQVPRALQALTLFVATSVLLPGLWALRNKAEAGAFTFTNMQGIIRAAVLEERLTGLGFWEASAHLERRFLAEHPGPFATPAEQSSALSGWATRYILSHPTDYAIVLTQESMRLLGGNGMKSAAWMLFKDERHNPFTVVTHPKESNEAQATALARSHPSLGMGLIIYLSLLACVYFLALWGFFAGWRDARLEVLWLALTAAYFFAVSIGFGAGARYRLPLMPPLFLLAGLGIEKFREAVRTRQNKV